MANQYTYASVEERFWSKVDRSGSCWLWTAAIGTDGYGQFGFEGKVKEAHQVSYRLAGNSVPDGLELDHTCHGLDADCPGGPCLHRRCVKPDHLEPVTHRVNSLRGKGIPPQNSRKTHCRSGHAFDEANTYVNKQGHRGCRACNRQAVARYAARKKVLP